MITPTSVKGSGYPLLHFAPYHMGISNDCYRLTNEHTYLARSLSLSLSPYWNHDVTHNTSSLCWRMMHSLSLSHINTNLYCYLQHYHLYRRYLWAPTTRGKHQLVRGSLLVSVASRWPSTSFSTVLDPENKRARSSNIWRSDTRIDRVSRSSSNATPLRLMIASTLLNRSSKNTNSSARVLSR